MRQWCRGLQSRPPLRNAQERLCRAAITAEKFHIREVTVARTHPRACSLPHPEEGMPVSRPHAAGAQHVRDCPHG